MEKIDRDIAEMACCVSIAGVSEQTMTDEQVAERAMAIGIAVAIELGKVNLEHAMSTFTMAAVAGLSSSNAHTPQFIAQRAVRIGQFASENFENAIKAAENQPTTSLPVHVVTKGTTTRVG